MREGLVRTADVSVIFFACFPPSSGTFTGQLALPGHCVEQEGSQESRHVNGVIISLPISLYWFSHRAVFKRSIIYQLLSSLQAIRVENVIVIQLYLMS